MEQSGFAMWLILSVFLLGFFAFLAVRRSLPVLEILAMSALAILAIVLVPFALEQATNGRAAVFETTGWIVLISVVTSFLWLAWRTRSGAAFNARNPRPASKTQSKRRAPVTTEKAHANPHEAPAPGDGGRPSPPAAKQVVAAAVPPGTDSVPSPDPRSKPSVKTIFISYRREDSADVTGRLYDRLSTAFGREHVYKDVDTIPLGIDFREHINTLVGTCDLVLAIIGRRWLTVQSADSTRRIDDTRDPVRLEISAALKRNIPVVPVLVGGSEIPPADALPEEIADLAFRNGTRVRPDPDFHKDVDRLIAGLRGH